MCTCMLITSNLGSLFEIPALIPPWISEFGKHILEHKPNFIAIHLQEIGGKDWQKCMPRVDDYIDKLLANDVMKDYNRSICFFDKDFKSDQTFTALGCIYLVHSSIQNACLYNFCSKSFEELSLGNQSIVNVHVSSLCVATKYPIDFYPQFPEWTRKGHIYTKWQIEGKPLEFVNIHLFHDQDNTIAIQESPSVYSVNRQRALEYSLKAFSDLKLDICPQFIFGDFNFRLNQCQLEQFLLGNGFQNKKDDNDNGKTKLNLIHENGNYLIIEKKKFSFKVDELMADNKALQQFDTELEYFKESLFEIPITFTPTYPLSESLELPQLYAETRAPSWCDRILMNKLARDIVLNNAFTYNSSGKNVSLGDHKPVYLVFVLK